MELLIETGLPPEKRDSVNLNSKGSVTVRNLDNETCLKLIENIHGKYVFSRKIYCNGIIPMSPVKDNHEDVQVVSSEDQPLATNDSTSRTPISKNNNVTEHTVPTLLSPLASPAWPVYEAEDLARRHSLSLLNRTPPKGSLAEDLLGLPKYRNRNLSSLSDNIKDLAETLSDFNSCLSSSPSEASDGENKKRVVCNQKAQEEKVS